MAHLTLIDNRCSDELCASRAVYRIVSDHDGETGDYCRRHATLALQRQEQKDQEAKRRSRDVQAGKKFDGMIAEADQEASRRVRKNS